MHVCFHWTKNINTVPTWRHIYLLNDCLFHNAIPDDFSFFIGKSLWGADLSPAFVTFLLLILILMFSVLKHKGPEMWRSDTQIELAGCKWICWLNHRTLKNKSPVLMICTVSLSPWPSSPKHFSFTMIKIQACGSEYILNSSCDIASHCFLDIISPDLRYPKVELVLPFCLSFLVFNSALHICELTTCLLCWKSLHV